MVDLHAHYTAQSGASFWARPRNAVMSREISSYSLARLNEIHGTNFTSKAQAVRRILYDGGFSYDGILPAGALHGDPQFTSCYDSGGAVSAHRVFMEHLERDVKPRGYDCTGRRQKSLYLQALAGNKKAREHLDIAYHGEFPSCPRDAWLAIEAILHVVYASYLRQYGCPDRVHNHPMYPAIFPPLPNPVKLRGFILRARKARDAGTLTWMLGRDLEPHEMSAENKEQLIQSVLSRFGYTSTEIAVMKNIVSEQEAKRNRADDDGPNREPKAGGFLPGCSMLFVSIALCFGGLSFAAYLMRGRGIAGNIAGIALLLSVLGFLIILCRVFRGKKGRPP